MNEKLRSELEAVLGEPIVGMLPTSGKVQTRSGRQLFLKRGATSKAYRCEAVGLAEIASAGEVATPEVIAVGKNYILTEYVSQQHRGDRAFFEDFGRRLARLHRHTVERFGFREDNFIGLTPQINTPEGAECKDWALFYLNKRLRYQFRLAEQNGYVSAHLAAEFSRFEAVAAKLLNEAQEAPSLIHGDLWSGNFLCGAGGEVVLIDPAVYYGHREAELAMTHLFGGFPQSFYDAYMREYPLQAGWQRRENLYRLYHLMNHLNLFGRSYLAEVEYIISEYASMRA